MIFLVHHIFQILKVGLLIYECYLIKSITDLCTCHSTILAVVMPLLHMLPNHHATPTQISATHTQVLATPTQVSATSTGVSATPTQVLATPTQVSGTLQVSHPATPQDDIPWALTPLITVFLLPHVQE